METLGDFQEIWEKFLIDPICMGCPKNEKFDHYHDKFLDAIYEEFGGEYKCQFLPLSTKLGPKASQVLRELKKVLSLFI